MEVREFLSLFLLTRFVMPLPSRFSVLRLLANFRTAASCSMHFSLILLFARLSDSIWQSQIALARCYTPESVILLFERSSSLMNPTDLIFLLISLIYWSPMFLPDRFTHPSCISVLKALPIADSFDTFLPPAAVGGLPGAPAAPILGVIGGYTKVVPSSKCGEI